MEKRGVIDPGVTPAGDKETARLVKSLKGFEKMAEALDKDLAKRASDRAAQALKTGNASRGG